MSESGSTGARTRARELLVQALYQKQLAGHSCGELLEQFHLQAAYQRVDKDFFDGALPEICEAESELVAVIDGLIDRPFEQLDPVEVAVLLIGVHELQSSIRQETEINTDSSSSYSAPSNQSAVDDYDEPTAPKLDAPPVDD